MEQNAALPVSIKRYIWAAGGTVLGFVIFVGTWSSLAEITTTLRIPGTLDPAAPSHDLQHTQAGRLSAVAVAMHQYVRAGETLFTFDTSDEEIQLKALKARLEIVQAERDALTPSLNSERGSKDSSLSFVDVAFAAEKNAFAAQIAEFDASKQGIETRIHHKQSQLQHESDRLALVEAEHARQSKLQGKGFVALKELETVHQSVLAARSAVARLRAEIEADRSALRELEAKRSGMTAARAQDLSQRRLANEKELPELRANIARLRRTIEEAVVVAPVDGQITALSVPTEGGVANAGAVLATLTQADDGMVIKLQVPPSNIDQVFVGQMGKLTIPALPQRTAPNLPVTISDIAAEPVLDDQDQPLFYLASARFEPSAFQEALGKSGPKIRLSAGMPVNAALEGRPTTLAQFVTGPFTGLLTAAFQD